MDQFFISAALPDFSLIKDQDAVAVFDGTEPVGNDDPGTSELIQSFRDLALGLVVQGAGRFVKHQDPGLGCHGAGDHQALLLSSRDTALALTDHCVHSHGHSPDIIGDPGHLRCFPGPVEGQLRRADHDIGENVSLKERSVLGDSSDLSAQGLQIELFYIFSVIIDGALLRSLESQQKPHQSALSAAGPADQGDIFPGPDLQVEVLDDIGKVFTVTEGDIADLYSSGDSGQDLPAFGYFRFCLQNRLRHLQDRADLGDRDRDSRQRGESSHDHTVGHIKGNIFRGGHSCRDCCIIQDSCPDQVYCHHNSGIEFDEKRRIIGQAGCFCIGLRPPGEGPLFRAREFDLLYTGDQREGDAVFLDIILHRLSGDTHLHKSSQKGECHSHQNDDDSRQCQPRCEMKDLGNV